VHATLEELNACVTDAILRAERAATDSDEAAFLYRQGSELEEQISDITTPKTVEGGVARVGAVTAALDADDWVRASRLAEAYLVGAPADLEEELRDLLAEADLVARKVAEPDVRPVEANLEALAA
jgi:hypothetical protein